MDLFPYTKEYGRYGNLVTINFILAGGQYNSGNSSPSTLPADMVVPLTSGGEFSGSLNGNSDHTGAEVEDY